MIREEDVNAMQQRYNVYVHRIIKPNTIIYTFIELGTVEAYEYSPELITITSGIRVYVFRKLRMHVYTHINIYIYIYIYIYSENSHQ